MTNETIEQKVRRFQRFFGHRSSHTPHFLDKEREDFRLGLIDEEVDEIRAALAARDMTGVADGLADLVYVVVGTAVEMGIPFDRVFNVVHNANMDKSTQSHHDPRCKMVLSPEEMPEKCTCGAVLYTPEGKTKKPEYWNSPEPLIALLLSRLGYREENVK